MSLDPTVIAVAREEGSGGREIAQQLAKKLKFAYIDNQIIQLVARQLGISEAEISELETRTPTTTGPRKETATANSQAAMARHMVLTPQTNSASEEDNAINLHHSYHQLVEELIQNIARRGRVVVLGRAANFVLKDEPGVVRVLVRAPLANRIERLSYLEHISREAASQRIERLDTARANYARYYYNADWRDPDHYDLLLNTAQLPLTVATDAICAFIKQVKQERHVVNKLALHCSYEQLAGQDNFNVEQAAELLMTSPDLLRQEVYRGSLKGKLVDHRVQTISREDLLQWLNQRH